MSEDDWLDPGEVSRRLGIRERSMRRMLGGGQEIPDPIAGWLEAMVAYMPLLRHQRDLMTLV